MAKPVLEAPTILEAVHLKYAMAWSALMMPYVALLCSDVRVQVLAIVPVKVKRKGRDTAIITYAFLDSDSNSTFCKESLMKQLGIDGLQQRFSSRH